MEIKQLEYVIMAADMGSFNKASQFLYTTQSNVSKVIRNLELELGYDIFRRQGNGVFLTDAGKFLYEQSQQILSMLNKLETFSDLHQRTCFHIASVVSNFLAKEFAKFVNQVETPTLCLKMMEGSISRIIDLVVDREAELGLLYLGDNQREAFHTLMQRKGLYFEPILPAHIEVCVGPKNAYYNKKCISANELQQMEFVKFSEDNLSKSYHLLQAERELRLEKKMTNAIEVESDYALINILLETSKGYLSYGIESHFNKTFIAELKDIPIEYCDENIHLGYIHQNTDPLSPLASQLLEQLRSYQ